MGVHKFQITEENLRSAYRDYVNTEQRNSRCCMFHQALRPLIGHTKFVVLGDHVEAETEAALQPGDIPNNWYGGFLAATPRLGLLYSAEAYQHGSGEKALEPESNISNLQTIHDNYLGGPVEELAITEDQFVTHMLDLVKEREFYYVEAE